MKRIISRSALAIALGAGVAAAGMGLSAPAMAQRNAKAPAGPKIEFSKPFVAAAGELEKSLNGATKNPAVMTPAQAARSAGTNAAARAAAIAEVDAALGGAKAKLDAAAAVATTTGDKMKLGEMQRMYGALTDDAALQYQGLVAMLDSGLVPTANQGQLQWLAGVAAYQKRDFSSAAKYVQLAKDGGFQDPQLDALLADSYKRSNNPAAALQAVQREIAAAKAAGSKPSESSIRTGLQAAYDGKQLGPATEYSALLAQYYPGKNTWNTAINIVRQLAVYQKEESLDLLRLMARTDSFNESRDYIDYIQFADVRRNPAEVAKTVDAGIAAGKLKAADTFVAENKTLAASTIASDRKGLPALERDARVPTATLATVTAAGDTFLSYGEPAKAVEFYTLALGKPGADAARLNTRLGIAQVDKGDYAGAQATFAKIDGARKPLAQLWSAYAAQKAAGG